MQTIHTIDMCDIVTQVKFNGFLSHIFSQSLKPTVHTQTHTHTDKTLKHITVSQMFIYSDISLIVCETQL